jgi:sulfide dehydrogenase cytochrome subunit
LVKQAEPTEYRKNWKAPKKKSIFKNFHMNRFLQKNTLIVGILGLGLWLTACNKDLSEKEDSNLTSRNNADVVPKAAMADLPGRTLAANCFQCHGTNGYAGELKIAGQGAGGIIDNFTEFRAESPRDNIMNLHAYAYTPEEIKIIAEYFAKQ